MAVALSARLNRYDEALADASAPDQRPRLAGILAHRVKLSVFDNLERVESEWRAFEQHADCTVFQTFDWLNTWQRYIGGIEGVRPAILVGKDDNGETLFIFPLAVHSSRFVRELVWLGMDLCDYNAPLLAQSFAACLPDAQFRELWQRILSELQAHPRLHYDLVRLEKMPATLGAQPNPMLALAVVPNPSGAYATRLSGSWDAFYAAKRSSSTRSRDRGKRKKLGELGELALVHADGSDTALSSLDTLVAQKSRSFARMGTSNLFERPGHLDFYRALASDARLRPLVHLSHFDCGQRPTAVNMGLIFRDRYYHLQASHDDGESSRFGPGTVHLQELLRYAIERGLKVFDFTIGDEAYKRDWCEKALPLFDYLSAATARGSLAFSLLLAKSRLKRHIKQNPALWKMFTRARAIHGRLLQRGARTHENA
jgi:CelD/BcsL family acetyltransferase involved in cellulose biosynthesis